MKYEFQKPFRHESLVKLRLDIKSVLKFKKLEYIRIQNIVRLGYKISELRNYFTRIARIINQLFRKNKPRFIP